MSSYDQNSYNTNSFSILGYDFGTAWRQIVRFSLRAVTATKIALGARI